MGKINCHKHGLGGITLVCSHIRNAVDAGEVTPPHRIIQADPFDDAELLMKLFFCEACVTRSALNADVIITEIPSGLEPLCIKCLFESVSAG